MIILKAALSGAAIAGQFIVILICWKRRHEIVAAGWQIGVMLGGMLWCAGMLATNFLAPSNVALIISGIKTLGIPIMAVSYYLTVHKLLKPNQPISRLQAFGLVLVPILYVVMLATPATRQLAGGYFTGPPDDLYWHATLPFWLVMGFSFVLTLWAAATEAQAIDSTTEGHRPLLRSHLVGAIFVLIGGAASTTVTMLNGGQLPLSQIEWVTVALIGTSLVDLRSILDEQFLRVPPLARGAALGGVDDGILVFDSDERLSDFNPAASRMLGSGLTVGRDLAHVLNLIHGNKAPGDLATIGEREVRVSDRRIPEGRVITLVDVTETTRFQHELLKLNQELRDHVGTVERLRAELARQVERDALTGLYNRRALEREFGDLIASNQDFAIIVLDLDYFKRINDSHGHLVGDQILASSADNLRLFCREGEMLVRFGGEEFLLLLPGADLREATLRGEEIRLHFATESLRAGKFAADVTISAGVAAGVPGDGEPYDVLRRADEALYRAKANGRNRVEQSRQPGISG